jgi:hypothetical protein
VPRRIHPVEVGLPVKPDDDALVSLGHGGVRMGRQARAGSCSASSRATPRLRFSEFQQLRDVHLQIGLSASYHHRPSDRPRLVEQRAHRPGQVEGWVGECGRPGAHITVAGEDAARR